MSRRLALAGLLVLVALVPSPAADGQATCSAPVAGTLPASRTFDGCGALDWPNEVIVPQGLTLTLRASGLDMGEAGSITVQAGGRLVVEDATVTAARLDFEATAQASLSGCGLDIALLRSRSSALAIEDCDLTGQPAQILDGAPLLDAVRVQDSDVGLHVAGPATPRVVNSTFTSVAIPVRLVPTNGVPPTLRLEGTVLDRSTSDLRAPATITTAWYLTLSATGPLAGTPTAVTVDGQDGGILGQATLAPGASKTLLATVESHRVGEGVVTANPLRFVATQGRNATAQELFVAANRQVTLAVPLDPDTESPTWPANALVPTGPRPGTNNNGSVTLRWSPASDQATGQRAVSHYQVRADGVAVIERTRATSVAIPGIPEGEHTFVVEAQDLAGNKATANPVQVVVDRTPPAVIVRSRLAADPVSAFRSVGPLEAIAYNRTFVLNATAFDALSRPITMTVQVDGGEVVPTSGEYVVQQEGNHTVAFRATDAAGNTLRFRLNATLDRTPPRIDAILTPAPPASGWYAVKPTLALSATDDFRVESLSYRFGAKPWQPYTPGLRVGEPGDRVLSVRALDAAGNAAYAQMRLAYDATPPGLNVTVVPAAAPGAWLRPPVAVYANSTDPTSGLTALEYRAGSGSWRTFASPLLLDRSFDGTLSVRATDLAGNATQKDLALRIDGDQPLPPAPRWSVVSRGRLQADWLAAPPYDATSGVASIAIEQRDQQGNVTVVGTVTPPATVAQVDTAAGVLEYRVVVQDNAGRESSTPWTAIDTTRAKAVDASGPVRAASGQVLLSPPEGPDYREVLYYVDGQLLAASAEAPFTATWDTTAVLDGHHVVRVSGIDAAGVVHQDVLEFDVGNGYAAFASTHRVLFGAALLASLAAVAVGIVSLRARRPLG